MPFVFAVQNTRFGGRKLDSQVMTRRVNWLNSIREWQQDFLGSLDAREFVDCVTDELFGKGVFVFTPFGEVMRLPKVALLLLCLLLLSGTHACAHIGGATSLYCLFLLSNPGLLIAAVQMTASMRDSMHSALGSFEPVLSTVVENDKNLPDLTPTIILTCSGAVKVRPCRVHTHTLHDSCPSCPRSIAATARDILAVI